jgi:hypothetical protein
MYLSTIIIRKHWSEKFDSVIRWSSGQIVIERVKTLGLRLLTSAKL